MFGDGASASNNVFRSPRLPYVPPHLRRNISSAPFAGSGQDTSGVCDLGRRGLGRRRGRGRAFRGTNPSAFIGDELCDLHISEPEFASSDGAGRNLNAYDDVPVETNGTDVPPPASSFAEMDLGEALSRNIQRCLYANPTPVQRYAIPIALAGRDLMACAQTGSGKTAAFCFPIICGILRSCAAASQNVRGRGGWLACPLALILSPTRELACQIHDEAKKFSYQTGVRVAVVYGGAPVVRQLHDLEKGVDVLVATPGRLSDLIERARVSLQKVNYLALDEADRMLDMGFEPQIRKIVEQMGMPPPGTRQTMLFSATFPEEIQRLASDFLSNYIFLAVGKVGSSTELIMQRVEYVPDKDKRKYLMNLLLTKEVNDSNGKQPLTLVFVETKRGADSLQSWLCMNGFPTTVIHGDRIQLEREQALKSFKSGATPIMVATDVAARGLDIPHVAHVINFDLPRDIDAYVHRIGRTGRAGKCGIATALFSDANQPLAKALTEVMQESSQEVPCWLSQFAERSSCSVERSRYYGGGTFGGRDFRKDAMRRNRDYYNSQYNGDGFYSYGSKGGNTGCELGGGGSDIPSFKAGNDVDCNGDISSGCSDKVSGDHSFGAGDTCQKISFDVGYDQIVATGWD